MPPKGPVQTGLNHIYHIQTEGCEFSQAHVGFPSQTNTHSHRFNIFTKLTSGFLACVQHVTHMALCCFLDPQGKAGQSVQHRCRKYGPPDSPDWTLHIHSDQVSQYLNPVPAGFFSLPLTEWSHHLVSQGLLVTA